MSKRIIGDDVARFLSHVDQNGPAAEHRPDLGPCWLWTASTVSGGRYGGFRVGRKLWRAHKWAYEHWVGPVPEGLVLDHFACDVTLCVNPDHVRPATHWENNRRGGSAAARASRQTYCVNGHEFTPENTWARRPGTRACRRCNADRQRERRRRT